MAVPTYLFWAEYRWSKCPRRSRRPFRKTQETLRRRELSVFSDITAFQRTLVYYTDLKKKSGSVRYGCIALANLASSYISENKIFPTLAYWQQRLPYKHPRRLFLETRDPFGVSGNMLKLVVHSTGPIPFSFCFPLYPEILRRNAKTKNPG